MNASRIVLWVGLVVFGFTSSDTLEAQPSLMAGSATGAPGDTLTIPVTFANDDRVVGFQFDLQFNDTPFTPGPLTDGPALSPHIRHASTPSAGTIRVLVRPEVTPTLPRINSGLIFSVSFTIRAEATPGTYDLTLVGVIFSDQSADVVSPGTLTNGQITVATSDISVSPLALHFGGVKVGTSSPPLTVTVSNSISATANLVVNQIKIEGLNAPEFSQSNDCTSVPPGGSCNVGVAMTPLDVGPKAATLRILSSDPDQSTIDVELDGSGGIPHLLVRRTLLSEDFSSGIPGTWMNSDVWSTGCGRAIGPPFVAPWAMVDPNCQTVSTELLSTPYFDARACTEVALRWSNCFSPGTATIATVSVTNDYGKTWIGVETWTDNDGPGWRELGLGALSGNAGSQVEFGYLNSGGFWAIDNVWILCEPSTLAFKGIAYKPSLPQILVVTNPGTANLSIAAVELLGSDASHFQISRDGCGGKSIASGGHCEVEILFLSDTTGPNTKNANVSIFSDDAMSPAVVALDGKRVKLLTFPENGTIGSEVTIGGTGFGLKKGKVLIGGTPLKVLNWEQDEIRALLTKISAHGPAEVVVQPKDPKGAAPISEPGAFTVEPPEIWRVEPDRGGVGTEVKITGRHFGTKKGKVFLAQGDALKSCKVTRWAMEATTGLSTVHFLVPKGLPAGDYDLKITNALGEGIAKFNVE